MLRVLSKALARHLQKYPDQGYSSCPTVPDCVNKLKKPPCQRGESAQSPKRCKEESNCMETFTPQLEKHLNLKNTYVPELVAGMETVAKKKNEYDDFRRPPKSEHRAAKSSAPGKPKVQKEQCPGMTPFPTTKCPAQVERIKQSLSKREELKKKKRPEIKSKAPKVKETKGGCEESNPKPQPKTETKSDECKEQVKTEKPPKPSEEKPGKREPYDCDPKDLLGWAYLAQEMNPKPPSPVQETKNQLCYSCIEELWERGGQRGDCQTPIPPHSLQSMVKAQTDKLAGRLEFLGQKIEKDIADILISWEAAAKKAKKAMEDAERNQGVRSTSSDYFRGEERRSQADVATSESRDDVRECENFSQQEAQRRLISMLGRVRMAVNKTRALPRSISQQSNSSASLSREYSSSTNSSAERKEIEELYGLISAKGEVIARDIQNKIRKALKELKGG